MADRVSLSYGATAYWLSFGTGRASGNDRHEVYIDESLVDNIKLAINLGFTNIDTAERYGTERAVGKAIKESNLSREQFYIVTKIFAGIVDPEQDIKSSLARLGVECVDQYLIHSPEFKKMMNLDISLKEVWQSLETLVDKGYTKSIGISNAEIQHLEEILSVARIKPVINQIEYSPNFQRDDLIEFCKKHGIATSVYGLLASLISTNVEEHVEVKSVVQQIAEKRGKSPAQVLLRWAKHKGIDIIVTSSRDESRLREYTEALGFDLAEEEILAISEIGETNRKRKYVPK